MTANSQNKTVWPAYPWRGRALAAATAVVPLIVVVVLLQVAASIWHRPTSSVGQLSWLVMFTALGAGAIAAIRRATGPIAALARLLQLGLDFPGSAPNRWEMARQIVRPEYLSSLREELNEKCSAVRSRDRAVTIVAAVIGAEIRNEGPWRTHSLSRKISERLAKEMNVGSDEVAKLRWAVLAHHVGQLLSDDESRHVELAAAAVAPCRDQLWPWIQVVEQHHEHFDGAGWPRRLKAEEIHLGARIVAVADGYCAALVGPDRSRLRPHRAARFALRSNAGSKFDPVVVASFNAMAGPRLWWWSLAPRLVQRMPMISLPGGRSVRRALDASIGALATGALLVMVSAASGSLEPTLREPNEVAIASAGLTTGISPGVGSVSGSDSDGGGREGADTASREVSASSASQSPTSTSSVATSSTSTSSPSTTSTAIPTTSRPSGSSVPGVGSVFLPAPTTTVSPTTTAPPTNVPPKPTTAPTTTTRPPTDCERAQAGAKDLQNAKMSGCDLSGLVLSEVDASNADLSNARFTNGTIVDGNFDGASMQGADLGKAKVSRTAFTKTDLSGAGLGGAQFSDLTFEKTNLAQAYAAKAEFRNVAFVGVNAQSIVLSDSRFVDSATVYTSFKGARFKDATLTNVKLNLSDIRFSNWRSVTAENVDLANSSMVDSDFRDAKLSGLGLASADIEDVNFTNADLSGASGQPKGSGLAKYSNTTCGPGDVRDYSCWK